MALSEQDIQKIGNIIAEHKGVISKDVIDAQIKTISKQVEINTNLLTEIQKLGDRICENNDTSIKILRQLTNGISSKINAIYNEWGSGTGRLELSDIHSDVSDKNGYLPKISNQLTYMWVPMISSLIGLVMLLIKMYTN